MVSLGSVRRYKIPLRVSQEVMNFLNSVAYVSQKSLITIVDITKDNSAVGVELNSIWSDV